MNNSFNRNTIFVSSSNFLQLIVNLVLTIFLSRYFLDKDILGKYFQILIVINFLLSFGSSVPRGLTHFFGKYAKSKERFEIINRSWFSLVVIGFTLSFFLMLFSPKIVYYFNNDFFQTFKTHIILLTFLKLLNTFFLEFNLITKNILYHFKVTLFGVLLTLISVILIYEYSLSINGLLIFLISIETFKFFLFNFKLFGFLSLKSKLFFDIKEFYYIIPLSIASLVTTLNIYVDKFMVSSFLTPTDYAYYQLGAYTIPFIAIITGSVISVLIPTFSELYYKNRILEINLLLKDSIAKTSKFLIPILVYCVFFGEYIITSFYSDTFHISGKVFQLYCCIFFLSVVSFMAILNAVGKQNWVLFISIFNLIINLVLNIFLIPIYGIYGAVYSTIFTVYLGYLVPIILIKKFLNLSFFEYFPKRKYFKILVLSIIFALPFFLIFEYLIFNKFFVFIFSIPYYLLVLFIFDPMLFSKNNFVRIFNNED